MKKNRVVNCLIQWVFYAEMFQWSNRCQYFQLFPVIIVMQSLNKMLISEPQTADLYWLSSSSSVPRSTPLIARWRVVNTKFVINLMMKLCGSVLMSSGWAGKTFCDSSMKWVEFWQSFWSAKPEGCSVLLAPFPDLCSLGRITQYDAIRYTL